MEPLLKYGELILIYSTVPEIDGVYRIKYIKKLPPYTIDLKTQIEPTAPSEVDPSKTDGYDLVLKDLFPELPTAVEKQKIKMYLLHGYVDVIDPMTLYIRLGGGERLFYLRGNEFMISQGYGFKIWTSSVFPGLERVMSIRVVMFPMHTVANRVAVEAVKYGVEFIENVTLENFEEAMKVASERKLKLVIPFYPRIYRMDEIGREPLKFPLVESFTVPTSEAVVLTLPFSDKFQYSFRFIRAKRIIIPNDTGSALTVTLSDNLDSTNASYKMYKFDVEPNKTLVVNLDKGIDFYGGIKGVATSETVVTIEGYYW